MVRVPMRGDVAAFAPIENATVPLPLPLPPDVMVSHASLLVAVQPQPAAVVTVLLLELAAPPGVSAVGETAKGQGAAAAAARAGRDGEPGGVARGRPTAARGGGDRAAARTGGVPWGQRDRRHRERAGRAGLGHGDRLARDGQRPGAWRRGGVGCDGE